MILAIIFHIISLFMFIWLKKLTLFVVEELGDENYVSFQIAITTMVFFIFTIASLIYILKHIL